MTFKNPIKSISTKKFSVSIFTLILFFVSYYFGFLNLLVISYAITALHEAAHIFVAKRLGININKIEVLPFGITMKLDRECVLNPDDEIKIALAGPLCNIISVFILCKTECDFKYAISVSAVMGIFNLLPVLPLDGGRVLRAVLVKKFGYIKASKIILTLSRTVALIIILSGIYILYLTKFNFSVLLIGGFLIANITEERQNINTVIMKDILYGRKKLKNLAKLPGRILTVSENDRANKVLLKLTYDKYCIIYVVDDNMEIAKTFTETWFVEHIPIFGINSEMKKFVVL